VRALLGMMPAVYERLSQVIREVETVLRQDANQNERIARLTTLPAGGELSALTLVAILSALVFCSAVLSVLLKNQNIRTAQRQQYTGTSTYSNAVATTNSSGSGFCGGKNGTITLPNCDPNSPTSNTVFETTAPNTSAYTTVTVNAGGDLQTAINNASCNPNGTIISLAAGATFNTGRGSPNYANGPYDLPAKKCAAGQWIIIQSSALASLPPSGTRVDPTMTANMPNIQSVAGLPAIVVNQFANHYRFIGIQFSIPANTDTVSLIDLDAFDNGAPGSQNSYMIFDRCYIHGNADGAAHNYRRGFSANANFFALLDSYVNQFHDTGSDSQAILVYASTGPGKVVNNYLSSSGENILFGGVPSPVSPADWEVRRNHMYKPVGWKGTAIVTKNLFEIKNGQRILVDGNVFENVWLSGQRGYAWVVTPGFDSVIAPAVPLGADITFTHNIVRHAANGIQIAGDRATQRLLIQNNIFLDVNSTTWADGTDGYYVLQSCCGAKVTVHDHNTILETGPSLSTVHSFFAAGNSGAMSGWQFTNMLINHGVGGVADLDRGNAEGNSTINSYTQGNRVWNQNALINSTSLASIYPTGTLWATPNSAAVGFTDTTNCVGGTFTVSACALKASSRFHKAGTDGKDIGADIDSINGATAGVIQVHD
jgi:hypothetical protein